MTKVRNSFVTKTCSVLLCLSMLIGMIPTGIVAVFAALDEGDDSTPAYELGTLSTITAGGSVADANGENVVATFDGATLTWDAADPSIGRYNDGWWVGVKMTAPETLTQKSDFVEDGVDKVTYRRRSNGAWTEAMSFWNAQDSDKNAVETERFLTMWVLVNAQYLNQALADDKPITYSYAFNWNGDDEFEQNVTIQVNPNMILKKGEEAVYPSTGMGTVSTLTEGLAVQGDASDNYVQVTCVSQVELDWVKADPSIYRNSDGWWAGIKMTVPEGSVLTAEDDIKYQSATADGWSVEKSLWNNKDSANDAQEHFITLWGLINEPKLADAEQNNKSVKYMWRFDWDKDGSYEQTVSLEMAPKYITLKDENGVWVYPKLGTVETISGGTVVGNGTNNIVVNASDLTLDWADEDLSIGRYKAAWWAGIKITAPEGIVVTEDSDVKYQSKVGDARWSSDKSFYNNQDSAKDAPVHYMQMWTALDRTKVADAVEAGKNITTQWQFDWNKDGIYEQLVTFNIDPTTIKLNRVDRSDVGFKETSPNLQVWIGEKTYQAELSGTFAPGTVIYSIDPSSTAKATIDPDTGVITLESIGIIMVNATILEDDVYNEKTISFTFEVVKKQLEGISFEVEKPAAVTFGDDVEANTVKDFEDVGKIEKIEYQIIEQKKLDETDSEPTADKPVAKIDSATGKLKIYRSGIITVKATLINDEYEAESATYTLTINKAEQSVAFTEDAPNELTFSTEPYEIAWITEPQAENASVDYSIAETDIAEVVEDNKIKTSIAGEFTLTVTVSGDDCYKEKTLTKDMKVVQAQQSSFKPSEENKSTITYEGIGTTYEFLVEEGESSAKTVTYKVTSDKEVADFKDPTSPILSIYKSGEVTIEATSVGDDQYADTTIYYNITVIPGEKTIELADGAEVVKTYGIDEYTNRITNADDGEVYIYSIDKNGFGATIDETGKITFGDYNDPDFDEQVVTVTVIREENEYYNANTVLYKIRLEYLATPDDPYKINKEVNQNGWYNRDIIISPSDSESYTIRYSNQHTTDDGWSDSVTYDVEGTTAPVVYLRNADGYMTDAIEITGYQMDKTPPVNLSINYKVTIWETILESLFGIDAKEATVTLKAEDSVSGIDYIEYTTDNWVTFTQIDDFDGSYSFTIDSQYRGSVDFRATDKAGHSTECKNGESSGITVSDKNDNSTECDDGITIVVDKIAPSVIVEYTFEGKHQEVDNIIYSNKDTTVTFKLTADNFDLSEAPVVKVNGTEQTVEWTTEGTLNSGSINLSETGDYTVKFEFTDRLERSTETYEKVIHVDKDDPDISNFEFTEGDIKSTNENGRIYFDDKQVATVKIKEHNFRASDVVVEVTADQENVDVAKYEENFKLESAWQLTGTDEWTAVIPFDDDANYTLKLIYTDLALNSQTQEIEFTVDTVKPDTPTIKLEQSMFALVTEKLTFGFFRAPVEVTISSDDLVAGVKEIKYSYVGTKGEYVTDVVNVGDTSAAVNGAIKFTIPVDNQFKGTIIATAYDWAMIPSDEQKIVCDMANVELGGIVVDNVSPDRTLIPSTAVSVVDQDTLNDIADYDYTSENANAILCYKDSVTFTFIIEEANFYQEDVHVKVNGIEHNPTDWTLVDGKWQGTITLADEGDYIVTMDYTDKSGNVMKTYTSEKIAIDRTDPTIAVKYDPQDATSHEKYFDSERKATITIKEHNFRPDEVVATITAKDLLDKDVPNFEYDAENGFVKEYREYLQKKENWYYLNEEGELVQDINEAVDPDIHVAVITFKEDANYTFSIDYKDIIGNEAETYKADDFVVDITAPVDVTIYYDQNFIEKILSAIFFYNADPTVKISAKDQTSAIDYFKIEVKTDGSKNATDVDLPKDLEIYADGTYKSGSKGFIGAINTKTTDNVYEISFKVPAQFRGEFVVTAFNMAHKNSATLDDSNIIVVDTISPKVKISFAGELVDKIEKDDDIITRQTVANADENTRFVYNSDVVATITVNEANFYDEMKIIVYRDGQKVTDSEVSEWKQTQGTDEFVKTIKLSVDGDYQIALEYADKSHNEMDYDASDEYEGKIAERIGSYISSIHTIDNTAPVYEITYNNNNVVHTIGGREYYDANRTATFKVTDRNFRPNEVKFTVKAKDVTDADVKAFAYSDLTAWSDWTQDGITWTATVPFATDANYTVDFTYTDIARNKVAEDYSKQFTVDKVAPKNLTVEYVEPTLAENVIEAITFGFYKAPVTVKISATDDISRVYHFLYSYVNSEGVSEVNAELLNQAITEADIVYEGNKATATFVIPNKVLTEVNQFRGNVEFIAYDRSEKHADTKDSKVVVVDSIAPEIEITYTANSADTAVRYVDSNANDVAGFNGATQAYYNGNVTATIVVDEANFFEGKRSSEGSVHQIGILLTQTDNNGVVTKIEYLPAGSAQMFASETATTKDIVWTSEGDIHTFEIEYTDDADYVLTVEYVDFSTNEADITANDGNSATKLYNSKIVTIDKIDPIIKVDYSNVDIKNTIEGRKYFDKDQVATITVTEHNFRADEVDVEVIAQNVVGADVAVANFDAQLRNRANWKHYDSTGKEVEDVADGNVHVATITYSVDANYTFDIAYTDLANRDTTDYVADLFTVDKTATKNLTVSYSEPKIWDAILEDITFGFYNAQMTITITAEDNTSGVYHFAYSYLKSEGVSEVNAEIINEAIQHADIVYNGAVATATFIVPKLVLNDDNQFNGKVVFTAYDRSENNTEMSDDERVIVVDNIKPTSELSFNEPVQRVGDVSYYDGAINATVVINEANFYSEDVKVAVTKDGKDYPVTVNWTDSSVDVHVGTFSLTEDGDYIVNVTYTDRSTNEMIPLLSNVLTIDTVDPVITVSGIKHQSANNHETISFTVSVTDINIALESFKPVLSAVVKKENGNNSFTYESIAINLGEVTTTKNEKGETIHQYTVSNLEMDGFYSLVCKAVDYADRSVSLINSADNEGSNVSVETLNFSVNRGGSVFWIETEHNDIHTGEVFKDQLNGAYANDKVTIKLHEINVDKVDENADQKTVFTLNDGSESRDIVLTEQVGNEGNYAKNVSVGSGGWYESIYTLYNSNFDHDGVYSINVITYDMAQNSNVNTKTEAGNISFTLDRTKPVITANVTTDQRINDAEFPVEFKITENNLDTKTIVVKLTDRNGKTVETTVEELGNNEYQFLVKDGLNYSIEIVAKDLAGNESELYKVDRFTVSTNIFVLWYANTPLFWGSIAGAVILAGAVVLLVVLKNKKKVEDNK